MHVGPERPTSRSAASALVRDVPRARFRSSISWNTCWSKQLAAEAAQEEAAALAAREKAEAEAARARAVSELEDLLSYETAARELDRREVACLRRLDTYS